MSLEVGGMGFEYVSSDSKFPLKHKDASFFMPLLRLFPLPETI